DRGRGCQHDSESTVDGVSAEAKNFEAIVKAKAAHNKNCPFPPHTVRMNPFEIERMQWEEGDTIAGLVLEADPKLGARARDRAALLADFELAAERALEQVALAAGGPARDAGVAVGDEVQAHRAV